MKFVHIGCVTVFQNSLQSTESCGNRLVDLNICATNDYKHILCPVMFVVTI